MSFEKFLYDVAFKPGFGSAPYLKNSKERQNVSKIALDSGIGCTYLNIGSFYKERYNAAVGSRYVGSLSLVYDIMLSVFDVNSCTSIVSRFTDFTVPLATKFERELKLLKNTHLEARIIGLQNGSDISPISDIIAFLRKNSLPLVEVDLFGTDTRHICFDTKTGVSFDVLIGNRLYKPGELANKLTQAQFQRESSPATTPEAANDLL